MATALLQETRLRLIALLSSPECHASGGFGLQDLAKRLSYTVQNVHHHLKVLKESELVRVTRMEATQRIPRQFWVADVQSIRLRPFPDVDLLLDLAPPMKAVDRLTRAAEAWKKRHGETVATSSLVGLGAFIAGLDGPAAHDLLKVLSDLVGRRKGP